MKKSNKILVFSESCKIVKGFNKSIIIDFQRAKTYNVPNEIEKIIKIFSQFTIEEVALQEKFKKNINTFKDYYEFLVNNEICHLIDKEFLRNFCRTNLVYETSSIKEFLFWEYKDNIDINLKEQYVKLFQSLILKHLTIKIDNEINKSKIKLLCEIINEVPLSDCQIIFNLKNHSNSKMLQKEFEEHGFAINTFFIYNSPESTILNNKTNSIYLVENSYDENFKNKLNGYQPIIDFNVKNFYLSQNKNTYYSNRLFLRDGYFYEDIFFKKKLIKVSNSLNLTSLIDKTENKYIPKDKIEVCKSCEYRYNCVDERIPIKKGQSFFYFNECVYNPFISKWKHENNYLKLQDCGVFIKSSVLYINRQKLSKVNKQIWGDV